MRRYLLIATAIGEAGTGLALLFVPALVFALLLGVSSAGPEALFVGRIAGAALLAIGVACWFGRNDERSPAQVGLVRGVLIYDLLAAGLLAYAGLLLDMTGIALWPAVALHTALAAWCIISLLPK
jgi:Kef-type K+ transport system membrane component KefB